MPEPITATLVSVTVITVAVCAYKAVDKVVSAPKELVVSTGKSAEAVVRSVGEEFRRLFGANPRISVQRTVLQRAAEAICEVCLYKQTIEIEENWENKAWLSRKQFGVKQQFVIKAGFDLNRLRLELDGNRIVATVAGSTILNVEYGGHYQVLKDESGWWNRLTSANRDAIINSLPSKAREEAKNLKLPDKAADQLRLLLNRVFGDRYEVVLKAADDTLYFEEKPGLQSLPQETLNSLGLIETLRRD